MRHTARPPPPWPGEERGRECRRGRPAPRSPPPRAPAAPRTASSSRISKTRLALPRSPSTASRLAASAGRAMLCWGSSAQSGAGTARLRGGAAQRGAQERAGYKMYTLLQLRVGYSAIPHSAAGARTGVQRPGDARQRSEQRRNLQHGAALQQRTALSIGQRCPGRLLCRAHSGTAPP